MKKQLFLLVALTLACNLEAKISGVRSKTELDNLINSGTCIVVKFYSPTCPPCKRMKPILEELSETYKNVTFVEVNDADDSSTPITKQYGIRGLPTLVLINNKKEVKKLVGFKSKKELESELKSAFNLK